MIFKIVLIEDSINDQNAAKACFEEWSKKTSVPIQLLCYGSASEFFDHKKDWEGCVGIFLDIDLPSVSGIEIAQKLRADGVATDFIFLTSFKEYVFEGYSVSAIDILLKPLNELTLNKCMQRLLARYQSGLYTFRQGNDIVQIPYSDILYFSSAQHYTEIVTCTQVLRQRKSISEILTTLPEQFIQIHRTIIINLHKVYSISRTTVIMSNKQQLPVSKTYVGYLNDEFAKYMF
jgi:DNA-binding LytR/AlgR family response regulator